MFSENSVSVSAAEANFRQTESWRSFPAPEKPLGPRELCDSQLFLRPDQRVFSRDPFWQQLFQKAFFAFSAPFSVIFKFRSQFLLFFFFYFNWLAVEWKTYGVKILASKQQLVFQKRFLHEVMFLFLPAHQINLETSSMFQISFTSGLTGWTIFRSRSVHGHFGLG